MQRLFPMFPQGAPGIALLLLRLSVAAIFSITFIMKFGLASPWLVLPFVLAASAFITIGLLTPIVASLACVSAIVVLLINFRSHGLILLFLIINSASLVLLGPGAYSLDARLFGRRVTVLSTPKDSRGN